MKKLSILLLAIVLLFTSCNTSPLDVLNNILSAGESGKIKQMSNAIIKCFTEKDKEALKDLFCEQVRNSPDFDEEIDKAFEYCKCDIYITSTIKDSASGGSYTEYGKRLEWYVGPDIPYFEILTETDSGDMESRYYAIYYYWQIIYEADKTLEGLHYIEIELLNVDSMVIGEKTSITNYNPF